MATHLSSSEGTIRSANVADTAALARLMSSVDLSVMPFGVAEVAASLQRGHVIVLDVGAGVLGAAALIELEHTDDKQTHGRIRWFVIHPALAGTSADEQMAAAVVSACEASGCTDLDVVGAP
ncbi:MAG: hypothetical protein SFX73_16900 [Kofleriaceae bacterium]|nr:hypothetical protein [Kofleriaceae bacterium]